MSDTFHNVYLLQPDDSRRVADALIEMVERTDLAEGLERALTSTDWREGWFPANVCDALDRIRDGILAAAEDAVRSIGKK